MGTTDALTWKVNVVGANLTIKEPKNPNDTVIFINGDRQNNPDDQDVSDGQMWVIG